MLSTYTVSNTNDDTNPGSLRWAITQVNGDSTLDTIDFAITGNGVQTIKLGSPLPAITNAVVIDGTTQGNYTSTPLIELDGSALGAGDSVLSITAGGSTVKALAINGCPGVAISLSQNGNDSIVGCFIGTSADGTIAKPNGIGIDVSGSSGNVIGGLGIHDPNVISGNTGDGIRLWNGSANTLIEGNFIGVDWGGTSAVANGGDGIVVGQQAASTSIGGTATGARNIISGNAGNGINLGLGDHSIVQGNYIGIDVTGNRILGNGLDGILFAGGSNNTIGGTASGAGNVISGNGQDGIGYLMSGLGNNVIQGNSIGVNAGGPVPAVNPQRGFNGLGFADTDGYVPPDTIAAVGQAHVIETVNTNIRISDKTGAVITTQKLGDFFPGSVPGDLFDPIVFYDDNAGRFVVAVLENPSGTATSFLNIAFSDVGNETSFSSKYRIDVQEGNSWADFPRFGFNADAVVIAVNMYDANSFFNTGVQIVSIDKSSIGKSSLTTVTLDRPSDFTDAPASMHGAAPGAPMYFVHASTAFPGPYNDIHVLTWADPLDAFSSFTDTTIFVPAYGDVPEAKQPSPGGTIDANDIRMLNVAWRNNRLVAAHEIGNLNTGDANARWYEFSTSSFFPTLTQSGTINQGSGVDTYFPSIEIDPSGNLGLTFMESSTSEFMSMYVTGQLLGAPAGTMQTPVLAKAGEAVYDAFDGDPFRAGDYSGIGVDPFDGSFWAANEYAGPTQAGSNYGTWIQQFQIVSDATLIRLGNARHGIFVTTSSNDLIGGTTPEAANIIAGNGGNGVSTSGATSGLRVMGNYIGTDPSETKLGNGGDGINLFSSGNTIGGTVAGAGNVIAFNNKAGVQLVQNVNHNAFLSNSIHDNGGLGINLGNGPTPNHPNEQGFTPPAPNDYQNYPILSLATTSGTSTTVVGLLNAGASTTYLIQFFASPAADPSGFGEGRLYLGSTTVTTGIDFNAGINTTLPVGAPVGWVVSATATDPLGNTSEFSPTLAVRASADMGVEITASPSGTVYVGDTLTYTVTVTNHGPLDEPNAILTDTLPANVTFVSATTSQGSVRGFGGFVVANLGNIPSGGTATVTILARPTASAVGTVTNTVSVAGANFDPGTANNTQSQDSTVLPKADLAITQVTAAPSPGHVDQDLVYTVTAINNGPSAATGVVLTDILPTAIGPDVTATVSISGVTPTIINGTVTADLGTLASGATVTLTITVQPTEAAVGDPNFLNSAAIVGVPFDPNTANNTATTTTAINPAVDLAITQFTATPDPIEIFQNLTYTAKIVNNGPSPATGVVFTSPLDATKVSFVSATATQGTVGKQGSSVVATIGNLAPGASAMVTIVVTPLRPAIGSLIGSANVAANEFDISAANNQEQATTTILDLPGTLQFSAAGFLVTENDGHATITVVRTNGLRGDVKVDFTTVPINATPGADYVPTKGTLDFPAGVDTATIHVPVLANPYDNHDELVGLVLGNPTGGALLGSSIQATLTIRDTDPDSTSPTVTNLQWTGSTSSITSLYVTFSEPLNPATAKNPANYHLTSPGTGQPVTLSSTVYDPSSWTVILTPTSPLGPNQFHHLVLNGTGAGGLTDLAGNALAGSGGVAGTNFAASFARGTSLKYTEADGDVVTLGIRGGGFLDDLLDGSNQGLRLTVVGEVPRRTTLTGRVAKGRQGNGRAYLGYTIYGLGRFGDVRVRMYSPPFQVDRYPFSPGTAATQTTAALRLDGTPLRTASQGVSPSAAVSRTRTAVRTSAASASASQTAHAALRIGAIQPWRRPLHRFQR